MDPRWWPLPANQPSIPLDGSKANPGAGHNTPWAMLRAGKSCGKSVDVLFTTPLLAQVQAIAFNDVLRIDGNDDDAIALSVFLCPPTLLKNENALPTANGQTVQISGAQTNVQITPPSFIAPGPGPSFPNPVALISWGVGGVSCDAEVDIINGANIDITASFLRVQVGFDTFPSGQYGDPSFVHPYQFTAFVGPGRQRTTPPTRTLLTSAVLNDGDESIPRPVPRFARRVNVAGNTLAAVLAAGRIMFYRDQNKLTLVGNMLWSANNQVPIVVPQGGFYWTIVNNSGAQIIPSVQFELAL